MWRTVDGWDSVEKLGRAVYSRCMSATRTQVYLTEEQRARIDRAAEAEGVTMAEVIRRAIDEYVVDDHDPAAALAATFGAAPSADVPSRDSWQRG
jgi:predicted DNA-binding protein